MAVSTQRDLGVARQGIFDRHGAVVGYELLVRLPPASVAPPLATEAEHERATTEVLQAVGRRHPHEYAGRGLLLFVNVPRAFVVGSLPLTLGPDRVVVEVLEHVVPDDELMRGVQQLVDRGYGVAVDDWAGGTDRTALVAAAQFVKIDLHQVAPRRLPGMVSAARRSSPDVRIVVERVESVDDHEVALESGADLFQGFHLEAPEYVTVR